MLKLLSQFKASKVQGEKVYTELEKRQVPKNAKLNEICNITLRFSSFSYIQKN